MDLASYECGSTTDWYAANDTMPPDVPPVT